MVKAKRGQVCVVHTKTRIFYALGQTGPEFSERAIVGVVKGINREGEITRYKPISVGPVVQMDRVSGLEGKYAIEGDFDHNGAVCAIFARESSEFGTLEEAREFLRRFLK